MGGMDHRLSGFHIFRGVFHRNKSRIVNGNYPVAGKQCVETEESDFSNVKFVSQRHSVFSRTARDRSAASSIFHSDPGTDVPVASGSVAADVSAPSGVGVSTAWATGNSVGVGDGSTTCAAAGTALPLWPENRHIPRPARRRGPEPAGYSNLIA